MLTPLALSLLPLRGGSYCQICATGLTQGDWQKVSGNCRPSSRSRARDTRIEPKPAVRSTSRKLGTSFPKVPGNAPLLGPGDKSSIFQNGPLPAKCVPLRLLKAMIRLPSCGPAAPFCEPGLAGGLEPARDGLRDAASPERPMNAGSWRDGMFGIVICPNPAGITGGYDRSRVWRRTVFHWTDHTYDLLQSCLQGLVYPA